MSGGAQAIRVPGKWVLAGEHSVLRGATAVALPHPEFTMTLEFSPERGGSHVEVSPPSAQAIVDELLTALRDDWESRDLSFPTPGGRLRIASTIPIGAGLGSSAALCVAISRWLAAPLGVTEEQLFELARKLEHRFHGRSSGMDIAVILNAKPISFSMERGASTLPIRRLPRFTFHDTGCRMRTSDAVHQVQRMREDTPTLSMQIDEAMGEASREAMEGLFRYDRGESGAGLDHLASAVRRADECFLSWGLVPAEGRRIADELKRQGALATKITGAGGGGMVIALWAD